MTATGLADPLGPVAIAGAMAVATAVHSDKGPLGGKGGFELPLSNPSAALALAATGPGRFSLDALLGRRLPPPVVALAVAGGVALSGTRAANVVRTLRQRAADSRPSPEKASGESAESATDAAPSAPAERTG